MAGLVHAGEDRRPRKRARSVLAGDPGPVVKRPLAHEACVLDVLPGHFTSEDRLLNTALTAK